MADDKTELKKSKKIIQKECVMYRYNKINYKKNEIVECSEKDANYLLALKMKTKYNKEIREIPLFEEVK